MAHIRRNEPIDDLDGLDGARILWRSADHLVFQWDDYVIVRAMDTLTGFRDRFAEIMLSSDDAAQIATAILRTNTNA